MTRKYNASKDKKRTNKAARKASPAETRANNMAAVVTSRRLIDPRAWMEIAAAELEEMNRNKVGRPFTYCDSMIVWIMLFMGYQNLDYRHAAGTAAGIMDQYGMKSPCYSTVFTRIRELVSGILLGAPVEDSRVLSRYVRPCRDDRDRDTSMDSTGLNLTQTSLWRKSKWGVGPAYKGWLKLHALTDNDTNEILAYVLTDDQVNDAAVFDILVELAVSAGYRIKTLRADAAYCSNEAFTHCAKHGIEFNPKFKSNTRPTCNGSAERGRAARLWVSLPYDLWLEATGYGRRWKVESTFSDLKRLISEYISAKSYQGMNTLVATMVKAFDIHKEVRNEILQVTGNNVIVA